MKLFDSQRPQPKPPGPAGAGDLRPATYHDLLALIQETAQRLGLKADVRQSNHEGTWWTGFRTLTACTTVSSSTPGAYTHTSIALLDALLAVGIPTVEVHLSDLKTREPFRQISYIRPACAATFMGLGIEGYRRGMEFLEGKIRQELHT